MSKKKLEGRAWVEIRLSLGVPLGAVESLAAAVEKANALRIGDIIDFDGLDHNDSNMVVSGVYMDDVKP